MAPGTARRGRRAAFALAVVAAWSLGCGRKPGPKAGETTLWRIVAPEVSTTGCDDAQPLVDVVAAGWAEGLGLGWEVSAGGHTARLLTCDESGVAISIDDCLPSGDPGEIDGDDLSWVAEQVFFEAAGCTLVSVTELLVTDAGLEGALRADVSFEGSDSPFCTYELDGEPIAPAGCAIVIEADLELVDAID